MYSGVFYERYRITPAYAGKSFPAGCPRSRSRDHPRVCGEKSISRPKSGPSTGSPPRMRGKAVHCRCFQQPTGITPAYAGKSQTVSFGTTGRKDHPRVCGEKKMEPIIKVDNVWITPAYAGKRRSGTASRTSRRDHPRVCGEKPLRKRVCSSALGSSPRMRGKVGDHAVIGVHHRSTPAYARKRGRGEYDRRL